MQKTLIVVAGPTAVGKTELCVRLAKALDTEVISADSRQLYRELTIGTAKPTPEEMQGVRHHFIDSHSVAELIGAGHYEREALAVLDEVFKRKDVVILAGGTGLYINAVCFGLDDMPAVDPAVREGLMQRLEREGLEPLRDELRQLDPVFAARADLNNTQRVIRALEVTLFTGQPFSSFRGAAPAPRPFRSVFFALDRPRDELYDRINRRVDGMLERGLVEEVRGLTAYRHLNALKTVGYREVFAYLEGEYGYAEMVDKLKQNTRRYAKRQLTWFRHQGDYRWFGAGDFDGLLNDVGRLTFDV